MNKEELIKYFIDNPNCPKCDKLIKFSNSEMFDIIGECRDNKHVFRFACNEELQEEILDFEFYLKNSKYKIFCSLLENKLEIIKQVEIDNWFEPNNNTFLAINNPDKLLFSISNANLIDSIEFIKNTNFETYLEKLEIFQ